MGRTFSLKSINKRNSLERNFGSCEIAALQIVPFVNRGTPSGKKRQRESSGPLYTAKPAIENLPAGGNLPFDIQKYKNLFSQAR